MTESPAPSLPPPPSPLEAVVAEVERHAAAAGWDRPPRLYALVPTAELLAREPALAAALGEEPEPGSLTPVEQDELPRHATIEELLGGIAWPDDVLGTALVVERLVLPPEAEEGMPADEQEALEWLAAHPQRQEVRVAVGVLRGGERSCALRMRSHDDDLAVLRGPDLLPGLADALAATLAD
ncbi:PPA1309 family protein [Motilibacter deserti]|uniref:Type III secretion system (T3SS) SseB-like protein n=1 Tax=Motilibacter deserti TaxID=2714956 RepID=A0ABX0GUA2_9ACTN|nr:PPA1309 family protein [Motilibacter deserti]NHC13291.1 hypothetical protein [Motilibacter deserti]